MRDTSRNAVSLKKKALLLIFSDFQQYNHFKYQKICLCTAAFSGQSNEPSQINIMCNKSTSKDVLVVLNTTKICHIQLKDVIYNYKIFNTTTRCHIQLKRCFI